MSVTTIGLDLAKSIFQVHGVDAQGRAVLKRRIRRRDLLAFFQEALLRGLPDGRYRDVLFFSGCCKCRTNLTPLVVTRSRSKSIG